MPEDFLVGKTFREKHGSRVLWPVGQAIVLVVYLWALYSRSYELGTLTLLFPVFPVYILLVGILPFLWLSLNPRRIVLKRTLLIFSILSLLHLIIFASKDLVLAVAGPYLRAHLQTIVDSREYEVATELYYDQGKPLGYVVSIKSKITSPNSIYAVDFDPKIVLSPLQSERVRDRYENGEAPQFRPTSFSQRKSSCEEVLGDQVCYFVFLPDIIQSEKNMANPRSVEDLCTLSYPVTVLINEFTCPYFVAPFIYGENTEKVYASIVPPRGYDGVNWEVVTTEGQDQSWVYNYDSDFYQPDRWDTLFGDGREVLQVLIRKNAYVRGFKEGVRTIANPFGPIDIFPVSVFNKDIFENAVGLPICNFGSTLRGPSSSISTVQSCRPHFEKYIEMDVSFKQAKPVIINKTGTVYFSDPQKDAFLFARQGSIELSGALAERDLFSVSKNMGDYTVFRLDDSSPTLFFSDLDSSKGGSNIRLSDHGGLNNGTQKLLYASGEKIDPQNRNVVGGVQSVTFQSSTHARKFMEVLYKEHGLRPNGNFPNEFVSERGHFVYWIHRNVLLYLNLWNSPEDFRKQAMTYYTAVFPPDFSPIP